MAANDGSEDVNDFLQRIRELANQRDKEDEERTRKLEEEILQGRRERQARRAERARSLSPTKDQSSAAGTPTSMRSDTDDIVREDIMRLPVTFHPPSSSPKEMLDNPSSSLRDPPPKPRKPSSSQESPQLPSKPQVLSDDSPSFAKVPSRTGTLSWQQRPTSRGSNGARARPLSQLATENSASRSPRASAEPSPASEGGLSRNQIANSLASKDPAWFRQTQERGVGSAALRRNQEDSLSDSASMAGSLRLPGMSRESTAEPQRQSSPTLEGVRSASPSRESSARDGYGRQFTNSMGSASSTSISGFRSPLPIINSQIFEPPSSDVSLPLQNEPSTGHPMPMSLSQGRISPERLGRPASPTKGLGGFVQSAMLKRSDSVSKRWSAQPSTGLSRGNSIASNRSGYDGSQYNTSKGQAPNRPSREPSPVGHPRPSSSQGNTALVQVELDRENPKVSGATSITPAERLSNGFAKPSLPHSASAPGTRERVENVSTFAGQESTSPSSPSKKWSPTKASWLENAINKPDSPKPKRVPPPQPAWMASVNQAKQQRGSVDVGKGNTFKEVSIGGLLRSPPAGVAGLLGKTSGASAITENFGSKPKTTDSDEIPLARKGSVSPTADLLRKASFTSLSEAPGVAETIESSPDKDLEPSRRSEPLRRDAAPDSMRQTSGSPISKSKPETPPKKDFRSALKPRQLSGGKRTSEEPEFKTAFGKLKRTQTQNYIAPNELKDNILRGKSGLVVTGGPKKTERRDEFKESLLKQKEAMKAGPPPVVGRQPSGGNVAKSEDAPIPEAIAKRKGLLKSESGLSHGKSETANVSQHSKALADFKHVGGKPQLTLAEQASRLPSESKKDQPVNGSLSKDFSSSLASVISRGPVPPSDSSKLSLISNNESTEVASSNTKGVRAEEFNEGPQLTHMTKSRAKGPKRRLPTNGKASKDEQSVELASDPSPSMSSDLKAEQREAQEPSRPQSTGVKRNHQSRPLNTISSNDRRVSQPKPPRNPSTTISQPIESPKASNTTPSTANATLQQPTPPSSKPGLISPKPEKLRNASLPKSSNVDDPPKRPSGIESLEDSSKSTSAHIEGVDQEEVPPPSVKSAAAIWGRDGTKAPPSAPRSRSPIKLPTRADEAAAMENAGLTPTKPTRFGLGINSSPKESASAVYDGRLPTPPLNSPKSPPLPAKKPASIANRVISNTVKPEPNPKSTNVSSSSQISEAARLFAELFEESPNKPLKINVDTPAVLAARVSHHETGKIRTLRKQIWEISSGGKLIPVPADQSHILFEEGLYICHHVFGNTAGTRTTEVYLWCGDGVAASAVEDAQLFAKKQAKDHNGRLIVLKQGKETPHFFQAFDGIIITRYGQSDRASKRYMLCGRRHIGQIAFDEVDFSLRSLCKGFPYIVSSGPGRLHLWKGSGSGADEIGCARLISNDLGAGGDVEEVDDGREPDAFWKLFPDGRQALPLDKDAKYWHLKPSCEHYTTRLYQVDIESPRPKSSGSGFLDRWGRRGSAPASATEDGSASTAQVREIDPFAQADIFEDGVFVLDCFFEVFVILPSFPRTSTLLPAFRAALVFAQEYAIFAASDSAENRPFVPRGKVVLLGVGKEDVPESVRAAFRKWEYGRVRGCRVLEVGESLEGVGVGVDR